MDLLEVGKIINTHGIRGELKVVTWTDSPKVFENLDFVMAKTKGGEVRLDIKGVKYQKNNIILKVMQIDSIEDAEKYKNAILFADRNSLGTLPEGLYYIADLLGCEVFTFGGEKIGVLVDVFKAGSNDVYDISRQGKKNLLVPIIAETEKTVDIKNKKIVLTIPEGLEDE